MTLKELREKLGQIHNSAKAILDKASVENRDLTAEESGKVDEIYAEYDKVKAEIQQKEAAQARQTRLNEQAEYLNGSAGRHADPNRPDDTPNRDEPINIDFHNRQLTMQPGTTEHRRAGDQYRSEFRNWLRGGGISGNPQAALRADVDTEGGFITAPIQFIAELIQDLDNEVFMRQIARVFPPLAMAASMGAPSLDSDVDDPAWTSELKTGTDDDQMGFGGRSLTPHPLAKRIKVSNVLIRRALMDPESLVRERLAYKFGVAEENAFLNGNGANQPLGVFVASANGIPTGRDVSADNDATAPTGDGLINAKYALKAQYLRNAKWLFHRDAIAKIRKIKDANDGQYIWRPGLGTDKPDTILDLPYIMSEYVPNTFTTGKYIGIVGDFRYYWIVDSLMMQIQRLAELYAETNQTGFIGRKETDGMPVQPEAFARVKLG